MAKARTGRTSRADQQKEPIEAAYTVKEKPQTPLKQDEWMPLFLEKYAECGSITKAAERASIGRQTVYDAKENNPRFAAALNKARLEYGELLIGEINRRAVEGTEEVEETVTVDAEGTVSAKERRVRRFSDTLLIFQTKAFRRDMYGDQMTVNNVNVQAEITDIAQSENVPADVVRLEVRRMAKAAIERQKAAGQLGEQTGRG